MASSNDGVGGPQVAAPPSAALDPVITVDSSGIIQSASDAVERVFGWTAEELIGRDFATLVADPGAAPRDGSPSGHGLLGPASAIEQARRIDARRKDGGVVAVELSTSRAHVLSRKTPLFVVIMRDLGDESPAAHARALDRQHLLRMIAEQTAAIDSAHLRLRMADRMASIGTLAAGLGHDMSNVLLPVRAHLNALRAATLAPKRRKDVDAIARGVAYLQQLADGLHFLALDPERDDPEGETDLSAWWKQTGGLISKAVPRRVRVRCSIPRRLPAVRVAAHPLTQAVLNLVVNAGEAIPPGRDGVVRIWAKALPSGDRVRLGVTDDGTGMSAETRRRAFELFFTTKARGLGTGLGLPLVHRVASRVGGAVDIESELGLGTSVIMTLPALRRPRGSRARPTCGVACVSIRDARAAGLVRQLLAALGVRVVHVASRNATDLWIVEPGAADAEDVSAWRRASRGRHVVRFGPASEVDDASRWQAMPATVIHDRGDFGAIRAALLRVVAGEHKRRSRAGSST